MRNTKNSNFVYSWVLINCTFNFNAVNVFATTKDHVFDAVLDEQETFFVDVSTVTGTQPTVDNCLSSCIRAIPVSTNQHWAEHADLAHLIWSESLERFWVTNLYTHWPCGTTCTCRTVCVELACVARTIRIGFGHAVTQLRTSLFDSLVDLVNECCRGWCSTATNCAKAACVVLIEIWVVHKVPRLCRYTNKVCDVLFSNDR